jgi:hypothetical protein
MRISGALYLSVTIVWAVNKLATEKFAIVFGLEMLRPLHLEENIFEDGILPLSDFALYLGLCGIKVRKYFITPNNILLK